jgi:hypothetical protein
VIAFHAARVICGFALMLCSYFFLAEFLPTVRQRRLGLLLVALGGGLGWLITLVFPKQLFNSLPVDFISPKPSRSWFCLLSPTWQPRGACYCWACWLICAATAGEPAWRCWESACCSRWRLWSPGRSSPSSWA